MLAAARVNPGTFRDRARPPRLWLRDTAVDVDVDDSFDVDDYFDVDAFFGSFGSAIFGSSGWRL
jgi:hypothetical protein